MKKEELRQIVADVLEIDAIDLTSDTDLTSIKTYDSVSILTLMVSLDERANIKLTPQDVQSMKYMSDIEQAARNQGMPLDD